MLRCPLDPPRATPVGAVQKMRKCREGQLFGDNQSFSWSQHLLRHAQLAGHHAHALPVLDSLDGQRLELRRISSTWLDVRNYDCLKSCQASMRAMPTH